MTNMLIRVDQKPGTCIKGLHGSSIEAKLAPPPAAEEVTRWVYLFKLFLDLSIRVMYYQCAE